MTTFADYVVYADESGDHSLTHIDETYPIFVLCFCVFHKRIYTKTIVPKIQSFKFKWFGHDAIVLHERDIRKQVPPFNIIQNIDQHKEFMNDLNQIMIACPFRVSASVIDKRELRNDLFIDRNPYDIAMASCVCQTYNYLVRNRDLSGVVHFLFEKRGDKEDRDLELAFRRIVGGSNPLRLKLPNFEIVFVDKKANSSGMQIADLIARPIGLKMLRPHQENRAFSLIQRKLIKRQSFQKQKTNIFMYP